MSPQQESMLWGAMALVGGFVLGRWTAPDGTTINVAPVGEGEGTPPLPPAVGETPPIPLPLPPTGDAPSGTYAERWEPDRMPYDVEIYPADADYTRISPPLGPARLATAGDCSIIAVPVGWWDAAGDVLESQLDAGIRDVESLVDRVMRGAGPACRKADTMATRALRDRIRERIQELPGVLFPPPVPPAPLGVAMRNTPRAPVRPAHGRTRPVRRGLPSRRRRSTRRIRR